MRTCPSIRAARAALLAAALVCVFAPAGIAHGQAEPPAPHPGLQVGDRVRLTAPDMSPFPFVGEIVRADDARVILRISEPEVQEGMERSITWKSVTLIERSEGFRSKTMRGAAYGAVAGALLGVLAYAVLDSDEYVETDSAIPPVLAGTSFGALIGVVVGHGASREEWAPLAPDSRVSVRLGASSTPIALGIRATF